MAVPISGTIVGLSRSGVTLDTQNVRAVERRFFPTVRLVREHRQVTIHEADIARVEVSRGLSRTSGAFHGAWRTGLIVGAVLSVSYVSGVNNMNGRNVRAGFSTGFAVGAAVGGIVGALSGRERWERYQ